MSYGPNTAFDPTHVWIAKELLCGGVAASIGIVIGYVRLLRFVVWTWKLKLTSVCICCCHSNPFDVIKVRLQTMPEIYSSSIKCFQDILKYEGVSGLYKGLLSPVLAQFFMGAISFAANSATMKMLEPGLAKGESGQFHNSFIAGSVGGFAQCVVLVPPDLFKCKMQTDQVAINGQNSKSQYSSSFDCAKQIIRSEGIRGT
jgi:solute carrier family 25 carnitine/acylcarnitine transporter 20/29